MSSGSSSANYTTAFLDDFPPRKQRIIQSVSHRGSAASTKFLQTSAGPSACPPGCGACPGATEEEEELPAECRSQRAKAERDFRICEAEVASLRSARASEDLRSRGARTRQEARQKLTTDMAGTVRAQVRRVQARVEALEAELQGVQ